MVNELSKIEKLLEKFYRKPIPNDITFEELERLANYFGCIVRKSGGKHSFKVAFPEKGIIIPIPVHGNVVKEAYIKQLKDLFDSIEEER